MISEHSVAAAIVKPNSLKKAPTWPLTRPVGAKITTSTRVMVSAARPISARPLIAAARGDSPRDRCRSVFSRITIESSTRMPIVRMSASVLMKFRLKPSTRMIENVASSVVGIDTSTISETRGLCRNSSSTIEVSTMADNSSSSTPLTEDRMNVLLSWTVTSWAPGGNWAWSCGISRLTPSDTSVVLAPV